MDASGSSASTGVLGLDDVLSGGLTRNRLYLVEGTPGSGKTTLALQFLMAGARDGESVLYVTLSETAEELRAVAESHGWTLDGIEIRELAPTEGVLDPDEQNTMFHPSETELASTTQLILDDVERLRPSRVVFDSLSELRLLAGSALRYRRQILALKQFFASRDCTVLLLDDMTATDHDLQMQSIAHGVVLLEQLNPEYGAERRRVRIVKYRGVKFRGGFHDFVIHRGGIRVFPRLVAAEHRRLTSHAKLASRDPRAGRAARGRHRGGDQHADRRRRGHRQVDHCRAVRGGRRREGAGRGPLRLRRKPCTPCCHGANSWGSPSRRSVDAGRVDDPAGRSGRADTRRVRPCDSSSRRGAKGQADRDRQPERLPERHARRAASDDSAARAPDVPGTNGRRHHPHRRPPGPHRNADGERPWTPPTLRTPWCCSGTSKHRGEVRQTISVMKKRGGAHERTLREFRLGPNGVTVGRPLREFRGVLTGTPVYDDADGGPKGGT